MKEIKNIYNFEKIQSEHTILELPPLPWTFFSSSMDFLPPSQPILAMYKHTQREWLKREDRDVEREGERDGEMNLFINKIIGEVKLGGWEVLDFFKNKFQHIKNNFLPTFARNLEGHLGPNTSTFNPRLELGHTNSFIII